MKILLSSSTKHFDPITKTVLIRHSVGVLVELFSKAIEPLGNVKYISDTDLVDNEEFDLIISYPRNFNYLTTHNKYKKSICFFNIAESSYLKRVLREESTRLGCKLSDCFTPRRYYNADLNFLIGNEFVTKEYTDVGVDPNKIVPLRYKHGYLIFRRKKVENPRPVFIHVATTLGLRKGFWHVVKDFQKANINAELWCVGQIQNERFWIDFAEEAKKDKRISIIGWIPNSEAMYSYYLNHADFMVFPSFGEGQPGTVIEAMECGCIPIITEESGISYYPLGKYVRGDVTTWQKAAAMTFEQRLQERAKVLAYVNENYDNDKFIQTVREKVIELCRE